MKAYFCYKLLVFFFNLGAATIKCATERFKKAQCNDVFEIENSNEVVSFENKSKINLIQFEARMSFFLKIFLSVFFWIIRRPNCPFV